MTDVSPALALRAAIVTALQLADAQNDNLTGALLASALDALERRCASELE